MLLIFKEEHQKHLEFLRNQPIEVVEDFCTFAAHPLESGANLKAYNNAAVKLDVTTDVIRHAVEALSYLVIEASRYQVSDDDLETALVSLGFSSELCNVLKHWVQSQRGSLSLQSLRLSIPHYSGLAWRFEASLASRSLLTHQGNTHVTLLLSLTGGSKRLAFQITPAALRHLASILEAALAEANSRHARRALRTIK